MKKRITALVLALTLCLGTAAGLSMTSSQAVNAKKASKKVQKLKTLQKALKKKKKKKFTKTFKTETGGTASIEYEWLKHKATVKSKGKRIIFTDTVKEQGPDYNYSDERTGTFNTITIKMVMNVGANKTVYVTMKGKHRSTVWNKDETKIIGHKWVKMNTCSAKFKPASYKKGIHLKWKIYGKRLWDSYDESMLFTTFRCWNSLVKKGNVSMKSIGFTNFKPVTIELDGYYR